jgi:hypothetical protein
MKVSDVLTQNQGRLAVYREIVGRLELERFKFLAIVSFTLRWRAHNKNFFF